MPSKMLAMPSKMPPTATDQLQLFKFEFEMTATPQLSVWGGQTSQIKPAIYSSSTHPAEKAAVLRTASISS